ncbi:Hypothetical_protein [Hexamita inflata]|uniref:Hypothetical_protein n=1 Tax=Hexamita inflata TaxID=28002 RepID=A0ABP1IKY2_9EUKA
MQQITLSISVFVRPLRVCAIVASHNSQTAPYLAAQFRAVTLVLNRTQEDLSACTQLLDCKLNSSQIINSPHRRKSVRRRHDWFRALGIQISNSTVQNTTFGITSHIKRICRPTLVRFIHRVFCRQNKHHNQVQHKRRRIHRPQLIRVQHHDFQNVPLVKQLKSVLQVITRARIWVLSVDMNTEAQ